MKHNLLKDLFTVLALTAAANLTAADWVRKKAPIMSEWGEKINPDKVWTEYPRPQMERSEWMSLNGPWDYCKKKSADLSYNLPPTEFNQKILVPFPIESALSGIMDTNFEENARSTFVYQRTFKLPKAYKGRHIPAPFRGGGLEMCRVRQRTKSREPQRRQRPVLHGHHKVAPRRGGTGNTSNRHRPHDPRRATVGQANPQTGRMLLHPGNGHLADCMD